MTRTRRLPFACLLSLTVLAMPAAPALAQAQNGNFLNNLFTRGEAPRGQAAPQAPQAQQTAQAEDNEVILRLGRMENALRQLTGTIEQLQYRNQQLETQLKRMQDDTEYRFQQLGSRAPAGPGAPAASPPTMPTPPAGAMPGRRGDAFDPIQHPNAAGAPRTLGNQAAIAAPEPAAPVGAPGGRNAGAPLDLNSLAGNGTMQPPATTTPAAAMPQQPAQLPGPPPRNVSSTGAQLATLPPSARPQDEYDLAYGYVLHKDYALAEQAFRDFLGKYPRERLVPDAQYWLGESLFQQQRYRDAAESFLAISTKYDRAGKAPEALLRLGQSLAALSKKEAACATLAEVGRKYPKASASVKRAVVQEQKRVHC